MESKQEVFNRLRKSVNDIEFKFSTLQFAAATTFGQCFQLPGIIVSPAVHYFDIRKVAALKNELYVLEMELNHEFSRHSYETDGQYERLAVLVDNLFKRMEDFMNLIMDITTVDVY